MIQSSKSFDCRDSRKGPSAKHALRNLRLSSWRVNRRYPRGVGGSRRSVENNTIRFPDRSEYIGVARLDGQTDRRWPTKLGVWHRQNGQHMTPSRHEVFIVLSSWNIGDYCTIDRQLGDEISSKVRNSLHNQATAFVIRASLGFSASDENCANQNRNEKDPANGIVSWAHPSNLFPHRIVHHRSLRLGSVAHESQYYRCDANRFDS